MNLRGLVLLACFAALGAVPAPPTLIAGAVRDQYGAPVANARVTPSGAKDFASTAADGTVAIDADGQPKAVLVECAYCEPARASVGPDGTFVAIVHRYVALTSSSPSELDVAHLPYSRAESIFSLTPFVVLEQSSSPLPGPQLSDRVANPWGGLNVVDGIPSYDIVANVSPLLTVPFHFTGDVSILRTQDAYLYGDVANRGTYLLAADPSAGLWTGTASAVRAGITEPRTTATGGYSSGQGDLRERVDAAVFDTGPESTATLRISGARASFAQPYDGGFATDVSSAQFEFQRTEGLDVRTQINAYRGSYAIGGANDAPWAAWSDVDARVDIRSHAMVAPFTSFRVGQSSGTYGPSDPNPSLSVTQASYEAGIRTSAGGTHLLAAVGNDAVVYRGSYPYPDSQSTAPNTRIIAINSDLSPHWSLEASNALNYRLPTLLQLDNSVSPAIPVAQENVTETTVSYGDLRRFTASATALTQRSAGPFSGNEGSLGASVAWQIAPRVSLRTWALALADFQEHRTAIGSAWLTYDAPGARLDVLWRRDLLDGVAASHFDGQLSGSINRRLEWFAGTEEYANLRLLTFGVRVKN